jgi:DNA polymerase
VEAARQAAAAAATLEDLAAAAAAFDGCGLKAAARRTVFADGRPHAPVMLIGEAPGKDEDEQGKPFVGRSGQLLDRMLAAIGLSRHENVFITNTVFWRPPGNRRPTPGETLVCLPFVERAIALNEPKILIFCGAVAVETLMKPGSGVMRMRGKRLRWESPGSTEPFNAMVMLHPAYLLRRPQEKALAWADLQALETWLQELQSGPGRSA